MATKFATALEFKQAFDDYNRTYPEKHGHEQFLAGHQIPLELSCEGLRYIPVENRTTEKKYDRSSKKNFPVSGLNTIESRYSRILDSFTNAIANNWADDVMGDCKLNEDEGSELWHTLTLYKIRRGYILIQKAAYHLAANYSFHVITGTRELTDIDKSLEYQEYFDEDERGGTDGSDYAYSTFIDALFDCDVDIFEQRVVDYLKEGAYEIASGD